MEHVTEHVTDEQRNSHVVVWRHFMLVDFHLRPRCTVAGRFRVQTKPFASPHDVSAVRKFHCFQKMLIPCVNSARAQCRHEGRCA